MVVDVRIWAEETFAQNYSDWQSRLDRVADQIGQAIENTRFTHSIGVYYGDTPSMPNPYNIYDDGANSDAWDEWLYNNDGYADDSNILVMDDFGGATFTGARNPASTGGECTLVGGSSLDGSAQVETEGNTAHYHDVYNVLHELSHALDAPTGSECIGHYYQDVSGLFHRTPAHTQYEQSVVCNGEYNPANYGNDIWDLLYYSCAEQKLNDE